MRWIKSQLQEQTSINWTCIFNFSICPICIFPRTAKGCFICEKKIPYTARGIMKIWHVLYETRQLRKEYCTAKSLDWERLESWEQAWIASRVLRHKCLLWRQTFTSLFFTERTSCAFIVRRKNFVVSMKLVFDFMLTTKLFSCYHTLTYPAKQGGKIFWSCQTLYSSFVFFHFSRSQISSILKLNETSLK